VRSPLAARNDPASRVFSRENAFLNPQLAAQDVVAKILPDGLETQKQLLKLFFVGFRPI